MGGLLSVNPDKGGREVGKWMHLVRWWGWCYWWEPKIGDSLKSWISFCIIFFFSFLRNCLVSVSTKTGMEILPTYFFFLGFKKMLWVGDLLLILVNCWNCIFLKLLLELSSQILLGYTFNFNQACIFQFGLCTRF